MVKLDLYVLAGQIQIQSKRLLRAGNSVAPSVLTCHTCKGWQVPALLWSLGLKMGWRRHQADQARRKEAPRKLEEWGSPLKCTLGWAAHPTSNPSLSWFPGIQYFLQARLMAKMRPGLIAVTVKRALHRYYWIKTGLCCLQSHGWGSWH